MKRSSGILMPIFSLPSPYGIGAMGKAAYEFADFLYRAGQRYWQMLPIGPTSYGDSPYQSFSAYAGNPYFIDLELLVSDGLLKKSECAKCDWGSDPRRVDYGKIYENRFTLLHKAYQRGWARDAEAVADFVAENERWLPDYTLYMACKRHFAMKSWTEWPDADIRLRKSEVVLEKYRKLLHEDVELFTYLQFLFFRQWNALRDYVHAQGIHIIGDLPIYVSLDSADVWAEPEFFQLDEKLVPKAVAGVPPDYFTADGQLWGNPLYDWKGNKQGVFDFWKRRIQWCALTARASCTTLSASTTSAVSPHIGRCPTATRPPKTGIGCPAPAWIWWIASTAGSPSWNLSQRILAIPHRRWRSSSTIPAGRV